MSMREKVVDAGRKVLSTDQAQVVVETVVDKVEDVAKDTVEKGRRRKGEAGDRVKARAARAGGRRPRSTTKRSTSRKKTTARKPTTKSTAKKSTGRKATTGRKSTAKKSTGRKATTGRKSTAKEVDRQEGHHGPEEHRQEVDWQEGHHGPEEHRQEVDRQEGHHGPEEHRQEVDRASPTATAYAVALTGGGSPRPPRSRHGHRPRAILDRATAGVPGPLVPAPATGRSPRSPAGRRPRPPTELVDEPRALVGEQGRALLVGRPGGVIGLLVRRSGWRLVGASPTPFALRPRDGPRGDHPGGVAGDPGAARAPDGGGAARRGGVGAWPRRTGAGRSGRGRPHTSSRTAIGTAGTSWSTRTCGTHRIAPPASSGPRPFETHVADPSPSACPDLELRSRSFRRRLRATASPADCRAAMSP